MSDHQVQNDEEEECYCPQCQMRDGAYDHILDTTEGLILLYAERLGVTRDDAALSVVHGLIEVLAYMTVLPGSGEVLTPAEDEHVTQRIVGLVRQRIDEMREAVKANEELEKASRLPLTTSEPPKGIN